MLSTKASARLVLNDNNTSLRLKENRSVKGVNSHPLATAIALERLTLPLIDAANRVGRR